jgi:DNA polymerase-4
VIRHPELFDLAIAHLDCDAFYAAIEKRDDPALLDKPVIVGGGKRGVVATCCYIARLRGVHSAMPMYRALQACPDAVVLRPNMAKYQAVGGAVRALMRDLTPAVEPLSIDEAYMDLRARHDSGAESAAEALAGLARTIERDLGVSASIGLSFNKFLAKLASDLDKPRSFSVIGREECRAFLRPLPVKRIWGVGPALAAKLARDGINTIGQLQDRDEGELIALYGAMGRRLAHFARGEDEREVSSRGKRKSVSAETTFETDTGAVDELASTLRHLCTRVAGHMARSGVAGQAVVLKLKSADFRTRTRTASLAHPTARADVLYRAGIKLLKREADGTLFRLIGIGAARLCGPEAADPPDMLDSAGP